MTPMAVVWRLSFATSLIVLASAMAAPVLAVRLEQSGHSTAAVGAFAMIPFLMVAVLIPVVPRVLARWGVVRVYRWGCLLQLGGMAGYAAGNDLAAWTAAAVALGTGAAALWNATEALLAREAPPERRGRVMGLYQTSLGAALALGPFVPALLGWGARPVLWAGVVLVAACSSIALALPQHATREPPPQPASGTWHALRAQPLLAWFAFVGGVFEAGLSSVSAAYASTTGLDLSTSASVAGAIGMGSFACQYPAGVAADRFQPGTVFTTAAVLLLAASIGLAFAGRAPWLLWALGVVWGGVGGALYTLSMVQVARRFAGRATAGGAAAMITGYTLGGTLGPPASGTALQVGGLAGLAAALALLALGALWGARRVER
ncbi:MAG TPA: MFS transporter [Ramlibacter sp.]|nr:MFS transporter [Ramlibacter sp.]